MEDKSHVGMSQCFICGEVKEILLDRRLKNTLPRMACYDKEPCDKCKDWTKQGIIFISVANGESGDNPYRTGGWCVIKEKAVSKMISGELLKDVLKKRICFIEDEVWDKIGLPRKEIVNA